MLEDIFCWLGNGNLYLNRVVKDPVCQCLDVGRHRGGKHDGLTILGKIAYYLHDVIAETHVQHPVSLIEDKETDMAQVDVA